MPDCRVTDPGLTSMGLDFPYFSGIYRDKLSALYSFTTVKVKRPTIDQSILHHCNPEVAGHQRVNCVHADSPVQFAWFASISFSFRYVKGMNFSFTSGMGSLGMPQMPCPSPGHKALNDASQTFRNHFEL